MTELEATAFAVASILFCAACILTYIGGEIARDSLPTVSRLEWLAPVYFGQHRASAIPAPLAITAGGSS